MNLPSFTRAALALGVFSVFAIPSLADTPWNLRIKPTKFTVGTVSGAAAHLNNHVYYAGGLLSTGSVTNAVDDLDLQSITVTSLPPLPTARAGFGLVGFLNTNSGSFGNVLVAVGGTNGSKAVGNVEMYTFLPGIWTDLAPMPPPRAYLAVIAGTDGKIYAIGGINSSGQTVGTVEALNMTTNTWTEVAPLNTPRSHLAGELLPPDDSLFI